MRVILVIMLKGVFLCTYKVYNKLHSACKSFCELYGHFAGQQNVEFFDLFLVVHRLVIGAILQKDGSI